MKSDHKASLSHFLKFVVNKHGQKLHSDALADIKKLIGQL